MLRLRDAADAPDSYVTRCRFAPANRLPLIFADAAASAYFATDECPGHYFRAPPC